MKERVCVNSRLYSLSINVLYINGRELILYFKNFAAIKLSLRIGFICLTVRDLCQKSSASKLAYMQGKMRLYFFLQFNALILLKSFT